MTGAMIRAVTTVLAVEMEFLENLEQIIPSSRLFPKQILTVSSSNGLGIMLIWKRDVKYVPAIILLCVVS